MVLFSTKATQNWTLVALATVLILTLTPGINASQAQDSSDEIENEIDSILKNAYAPDEPGASVLAAMDGQVVFRKGCGMASLIARLLLKKGSN